MNDLRGGSRKLPTRKRRAHAKSRAGCHNCKFRRVKCDETHPTCNNCAKFYVACDYDLKATASTRNPHDSGYRALLPGISAMLANETFVTMVNRSVSAHLPPAWNHVIDRGDFDRLKRWHTRTVFSVGTPDTSLIYQLEVSKLAPQSPHLLHAVLATTAMHDRFLQSSKTADINHSLAIECYHHSFAAALFNQRLSSHAESSNRNALWTTAVLLSVMAAFSIHTLDPEKSWPVSPTMSPDLDWLRMYQGLRVIFNMASPVAPGGLFHGLVQYPQYAHLETKMMGEPQEGIEGIPSSFVSLCSLDSSSNAENNPYHGAVRTLASLWNTDCTKYTMVRFLSFPALMHPAFMLLLQSRDSRAILILAYWYGKVLEAPWWLRMRAIIECQAICIFLERHHADDRQIMQMLEFPKAKLEALQRS